MRRFFALVFVFAAVASPAAAQDARDVTVADLVNQAEEMQGSVVVIGELIGDYGHRSDAIWSQLNGDSYVFDPVLDGGRLTGGNVGVAVRIPLSILKEFDSDPGGYRVRGPVVEVMGVWKFHDPERGGESYIDVTSLVIVEPGHNLAEHPNYWILAVGVVLIIGSVILRRNPAQRRHR